jgi:DNA-binding NtrC family response regulator
MGNILIVDDDPQLRQSFEKLLTAEGHTVKTAASGEAAISMVQADAPDLVIMDIRMPGMSGLEAFKAMHQVEPKLPVIIMTAYGTTDTAIEATKLGAFEYVLKPFEIPDILALISQALEAGRCMRSRVEVDVAPEAAGADALIGRSKPMQEVYKAIGRVAAKPFLIINCVAIPETLLESELFGYEKGAFTGAVNRRVGKFEQANGGTVFLDEIGDMPFGIQAKILRLLQERSIERLGGREPIPVDVRIIAATNRDLEAALAQGRFREDLYYRLRVVTLWLPPLKERGQDIILLAEYFLARFAREMDLGNPGMTAEAKRLLQSHPWPGNVRELANAMQKALIFSRGYPIHPEDVSRAIGSESPAREGVDQRADEILRQWVRQTLAASEGKEVFETCMDRFASLLISEALDLTGGNRSQAAKLLGISRPTLLSKIDKYGLKLETFVKLEGL